METFSSHVDVKRASTTQIRRKFPVRASGRHQRLHDFADTILRSRFYGIAFDGFR